MKQLKKLLPIILLAFGALFSQQANATHVLGSDITYIETSENVYDITINVYRDCRGVAMSMPNITLETPGGSRFNLSVNHDTIINITPTCDTVSSVCNPTNTRQSGAGVEKHVFTATVDLNQSIYADLLSPNYFIIHFSQCCRNSAINTGAANNIFYSETRVYNVSGLNSSPYFYEMPFTRLQVNRPFIQNFGGYDVDGDSLVFEMTEPLSNSTTVISYSSGFSKLDPFTTFKPTGVASPNPNLNPPVGFHLDQQTGIISMTPTQINEVSVLAMLVKEYRNGQIISESRRDMQFWVEILDNNLAHTVTAPKEVCVMAGDSIDFNVISSDVADTLFGGTPDSLFIEWANPYAGPTYSNNTDIFQTGTFKWVTTSNDVRSQPYLLTFSVIDNTCPYRFRVQKTVRVFVKSNSWTPSIFSTFTHTISDDTLKLTNTTRDLSGVDSIVWMIDGQFASNSVHFDTALTTNNGYNVSLTTWRNQTRGCGATRYHSTVKEDSIYLKSCQASYVIALDTDTSNPFRIYLVNTSYGSSLNTKWTFSDGDSVIGTGSHNFTKFGKYEVCLEVSNSNCTDEFCDSIGMDSLGNLYKKEGFTIILLDEDDLKTNVPTPQEKNSKIYPNPFTSNIVIEMNGIDRIRSIQLIDMKGQIVRDSERMDATNYKVEASDLSNGIYYLKINTTDGKVLNNKLIKQ
jgi:hypothetical protein